MIFDHHIVDILMVGIVPKVKVHYVIGSLKFCLDYYYFSCIRFDDFSILKLIRIQNLISLLLYESTKKVSCAFLVKLKLICSSKNSMKKHEFRFLYFGEPYLFLFQLENILV